MNAETANATARTVVILNIAVTLKDAGVDVVKADLSASGVRVDVRGKASATKALEMLKAAGLRNARALAEGKGIWLVVGQVA